MGFVPTALLSNPRCYYDIPIAEFILLSCFSFPFQVFLHFLAVKLYIASMSRVLAVF